ncbi:hypothetical protein ABIE33_003818 [Ensifer sp. 4252]
MFRVTLLKSSSGPMPTLESLRLDVLYLAISL